MQRVVIGRACRRVGAVGLIALVGVAACGDDDDSGELVIRRDPHPTTTTSLDREALGLNTDVSCVWRGAFSEDDWARSASAEERADMESLLDGQNLSEFFIHATEAETRQACELFDGQVVEHDR
jgi:hypothetical protein